MDLRTDVFNTDCMEYMRTLPDKAFALAIADPPYGIRDAGGATGGAGKLRGRVFNNGMIDRWDKAPSQAFFDELRRVSEHQIIWGGNYFPLPPSRCFVCWDKMQPWPNFSQAEFAWTSFDSPSKMFRFDNRTGDKIHPTQKPVELYAYLLQTFAQGGVIFDPMMGSQSSRIAAWKLGFDFVGCEIDEEYFRKGCERFDAECKGITRLPSGKEIVQTELF
jgi:site-specific DNA-methyltransferase (adenine-specific)